MAAVAPASYDALISRQQARIQQLEADLARYSQKLSLLKARQPALLAGLPTIPSDIAAAAVAAAHHQQQQFQHHQHLQHLHQLQQHHSTLRASAVMAEEVHGSSSSSQHLSQNTSDMYGAAQAAAAAAAAAAAVAARHHHMGALMPHTEEDERAGKTRYWTEMEHNQFLYAVKLFGPKNYVAISQFVGTRTPKQVRTHAQKYQMKLEREARKRRAVSSVVVVGGGPNVSGMGVSSPAAAVVTSPPQIASPVSVMHTGLGDDGLQITKGSMFMTDAACSTDSLSDIECTERDFQRNSTGATPNMDVPCSSSVQLAVLGGDSIDFLRDSASSPISSDSYDDADVSIGDVCDDVLTGEVPDPVPLSAGFRKNASLTNLADYDDFMRKITAAVHDRADHVPVYDGSAHLIEVDNITAPVKTEQFEDALLMDL